MSSLPAFKSSEEEIENSLMDQIMLHSKGNENDEFLAVIISSWLKRRGELPQFLGLDRSEFRSLTNFHFPGFYICASVRQQDQLDLARVPELNDLIQLFLQNRAYKNQSEIWIAKILAAACAGSNHLWQDLGLWNRQQLSNLISSNFPKLANANSKNMKWKKFFYKQLCNAEGIYICRSPSCEVCVDYNNCFGSEE